MHSLKSIENKKNGEYWGLKGGQYRKLLSGSYITSVRYDETILNMGSGNGNVIT